MSGDKVAVDGERLACLENDMEHTQKDVGEIKADIREIKDSGKAVEIAIIELATIAKTNQRIFPKLEALEVKIEEHPRLKALEIKVENNTVRIATWAGGLSVLAILFAVWIRQLIN